MAALALSPFTSTVFLKSKGSYHKEKKMQLQCRFLANEGRMQAKNGHFQPHALESKDKTVESIQRGQDLGALKRDIIRSVANTNRGKELEACNPTTSPIDSPLLSGFWSLLYTAPTDEKVDKYAGTEEGPFLARLKPLSFGTVRQTASFQVIDVQGGSVQNIADFVFFGIKGRLVIKGRAVKSSTPGKEYRRIDVTFESFFCRIGNWQSPEIPLDWVNPKGWVDTTFLDQDLRVGRGDKGSVFVSARVKE